MIITTKSSLRWLSVYSLHFLVCMNMLLTSADIAYCSLGESQPEANERASSLDSSADSVKAVSWLRLRGWLCYKRSFRTTHRALSTKSREASMNLAKGDASLRPRLNRQAGLNLGSLRSHKASYRGPENPDSLRESVGKSLCSHAATEAQLTWAGNAHFLVSANPQGLLLTSVSSHCTLRCPCHCRPNVLSG